MASIFGHAFSAVAIGSVFSKNQVSRNTILALGAVSAILPDIDIISFKLGIPYEHIFGHRGITHSIFFASLWALILSVLISKNKQIKRIPLFIYFFISTVSHGFLDAMTTGGRGIAFFAPFSRERFFLPWRFIQVSPIHIDDFLGPWGWSVLKSELYWIFIPGILFFIIVSVGKKIF